MKVCIQGSERIGAARADIGIHCSPRVAAGRLQHPFAILIHAEEVHNKCSDVAINTLKFSTFNPYVGYVVIFIRPQRRSVLSVICIDLPGGFVTRAVCADGSNTAYSLPPIVNPSTQGRITIVVADGDGGQLGAFGVVYISIALIKIADADELRLAAVVEVAAGR